MSTNASPETVAAFLEHNDKFFREWLGSEAVGKEPLTLEKLMVLVESSEEVRVHRIAYTEFLLANPQWGKHPKHFRITKEVQDYFLCPPAVKRALGSRWVARRLLEQQAA